MDQPPPASARTSFSDPPSATQGLIPLFDIQLRFLSDSYIGFFQERKRIEEVYIDSLKKLYRKSKALDIHLDERNEPNTTRGAWAEVRDNLEREAQARQAFCATLTTDILTPLINFKETQERTRKRVKEDLKDSTSAYNEYAETMLPRLKSRYVKKFSEVEEQKKVSAGPAVSLQPPPSLPEQPGSNFRYNPNNPGRPTVTSPQPLRALDRRPSSGSTTARNRSPSSSTPFSDLAHQGKKQFGQLIGLLDKGNAVKDGMGGRENQALKVVKAKREADEADKDYRKGVHWLETLRLHQTRILQSGYTSLRMFAEESATLIQKTLEKYADNMIATSTTQTQLSKHAREAVEKISSKADGERLAAHASRSLACAIPDPILYEHGQVGSCNDLIFGLSLGDYATAKNLGEGEIPKIVRICIAEIDKRGLDSEGIYRAPGRHAVVQTMQHEIEKDEASFEFSFKDDIFAVASLLKLYLRELPEPLFRFNQQDRIQHSDHLAEHQNNNFMLLRSKMRRLPSIHQATFRALVEHLMRVVSCREKNKMDAKNLAIVFGGMIFGDDELPKGGDLLAVQTTKDSLFEDLIMNAHALFEEQGYQLPHSPPHSPPLPPTPAGEVALEVSYGSKTTKIGSVPVKSLNRSTPGSPQDFTPRLPSRPATSIHPSARALPTSPVRVRAEMSTNSTVTQASLSTASPPSPASEVSSTDIAFGFHSPEGSSDNDSPRGRSSNTVPGRRSPLEHKKTDLPPTPQETPAMSPF
ncbi:hypothetical protein AGABI2DRAFT_182564 [Agaricus bisporus var. bisporus H97]|uniref:hypothetical protein n=1 Tax=Agaricus bisporus var. bisporus (strain H97 / ATCC MYA-4626 / FGSC 10389) TaxID=936046 RepID=UPI00029F78C9|nr:hypothetical protein AGABI2DRAFT_182564 [Agaricus bisporus var. bisporus H97]EKV51617.1 hypothetical protein AGABI2DRAFT_182564 [Agaricus bisporus var. bisporus H97]